MSFNFFDKIYCIHLPDDNRKKHMDEQFKKFGVLDRVEYVHAAPPPKSFSMSNMRRNPRGEMGVNLSQIKAIVHAINDGAQRPAFFENDVVFRADADEHLSRAISELPDNWDMFYMGGHPTGPIFDPQAKRYSKTLCRVGKFSFAEAFCLKRETLIKFYDTWCDEISGPDAMYDMILGRFSKTQESYCVYPLLCQQLVGYSHVTGQSDDKRELLAKAWTHHLGDEHADPEHLKVALDWRKANPSKWNLLKQRRKQGHL